MLTIKPGCCLYCNTYQPLLLLQASLQWATRACESLLARIWTGSTWFLNKWLHKTKILWLISFKFLNQCFGTEQLPWATLQWCHLPHNSLSCVVHTVATSKRQAEVFICLWALNFTCIHLVQSSIQHIVKTNQTIDKSIPDAQHAPRSVQVANSRRSRVDFWNFRLPGSACKLMHIMMVCCWNAANGNCGKMDN